MTRRSWLGELLYPLVTPAVVIPLLVSWVLFAVALAFGFFGLLLLLVTLVPFTRYLMALLRARAHNREAPVFDAELMSMAGNSYQLFPLVTIFLLLAALSWLQPQVNETVILLLIVAACYLFPASLAVLSLTRSPMQSWNPAQTKWPVRPGIRSRGAAARTKVGG